MVVVWSVCVVGMPVACAIMRPRGAPIPIELGRVCETETGFSRFLGGLVGLLVGIVVVVVGTVVVTGGVPVVVVLAAEARALLVAARLIVGADRTVPVKVRVGVGA